MLLRQTTTPIKVVDTKQISKLTVTIVANQKTIYGYSVHVIEYKTWKYFQPTKHRPTKRHHTPNQHTLTLKDPFISESCIEIKIEIKITGIGTLRINIKFM